MTVNEQEQVLRALVANPNDQLALAAARNLLDNVKTQTVAVNGLTNDMIKLQQGVGAKLASGAIAGYILTDQDDKEHPQRAYQNIQDSMGKVKDLSGGAVLQQAVVTDPLAEYTEKLADEKIKAGSVIPAQVVETEVGSVYTPTEGGEQPAGVLTTSAIASEPRAPEADEKTVTKKK